MVSYSVNQKVLEEAEQYQNKKPKQEEDEMALNIGKTAKEKADDRAKLERISKQGKLRGGKLEQKVEPKLDALQKRDQELQEKYPHYVPGSVRRDEANQKFSAEIECVECGAKREVWTSDLFQVKLCLGCKGNRKKVKKVVVEPMGATVTKKRSEPKNSIDAMRDAIRRDDDRIKKSRKVARRVS